MEFFIRLPLEIALDVSFETKRRDRLTERKKPRAWESPGLVGSVVMIATGGHPMVRMSIPSVSDAAWRIEV